MEANTFRDARVKQALAPYILVRADVTQNDAASRALLARLHAFGPPTLVFFGRKGVRPKVVPGYEGPRALLRIVRALPDQKAATESAF